MSGTVHRLKIAIGSLVAAWLIVWLIGDAVLAPFSAVFVVLLAVLIYIFVAWRPVSASRLKRLLPRWLVAGVGVGLLASVLTLLLVLCPPATEIPFAVTILGAMLGISGGLGVLAAGEDATAARAGNVVLGAGFGFATAFVLIFVVFAQDMDRYQC